MGRPVLDDQGTSLEPVPLMVSDDEVEIADFVRRLLNPTPTPSPHEHVPPIDRYVYDGWCFQDVEVVGPVPLLTRLLSLGEVGQGQEVRTSKEQVLRLTRECTELVQVALHRPLGSNLSKEMVDVVFAVAALAAQEGVDLDAAVRLRVQDPG